MALMVEIKLLKLVCANTGVDQNFEEMNAILCRPIEAIYIQVYDVCLVSFYLLGLCSI